MRNAPKLENGMCEPEDIAGLFAYLASDEAKRVTMEAIGQKSGFHSKSVFFKSFKDVTGVSPSVFLRSHLEG